MSSIPPCTEATSRKKTGLDVLITRYFGGNKGRWRHGCGVTVVKVPRNGGVSGLKRPNLFYVYIGYKQNVLLAHAPFFLRNVRQSSVPPLPGRSTNNILGVVRE